MKSILNCTARCLLVATAFVLFGCATARVVTQQPGKGGVISYPQGHEESRMKTMEMAKRNCKGHEVDITEEGEVVVGQSTSGSSNTGKATFGLSTNASSSTTQVTEWRMTYVCK